MPDINIEEELAQAREEVEAEQGQTTEQVEQTQTEVTEEAEATTSQVEETSDNNQAKAITALKGAVKDKDLRIKELMEELKTKEDTNSQQAKPAATPAASTVEESDDEDLSEADKRMKAIEAQLADMSKQRETEAKEKHNKKLENTIIEFSEATGISNKEEIIKFIKEIKEEHGIDFTKNPNAKTMTSLYKGLNPEKFEQQILAKIKSGEVASEGATTTEVLTPSQEKQQLEREKAFEEAILKRVASASGRKILK